MRYKEFGATGMKVSEMTLGTWGIGGAGWDENPEDIRKDAIRAAVEAGINFIDTAPAYNAGQAERYIGDVLNDMGVRKEIFLATKCGNDFIDGKYVRCGRPEKIMQQCENSLRNLKTDYIDLYLVHWPDPNVPLAETIGALSELKKQGKILHVGVSNFTIEQIREVQKYCEIEAYQPQYSMVAREYEPQIRWAADQGMGVMTYGSLGGGILTGAYRTIQEYAPSDNRNRFYPYFREPMFSKVMMLVEVLDRIAEERGVPQAQIALNWTMRKPFISTCIVGAQSRKKIEENCACFGWELSDEEEKMLDAAIEKYLGGNN